MLIFYLKSAYRSLTRKRFFSILNIAGLGIAIAIFLFGMQYYRFETGFNKFHKNSNELYRLVIGSRDGQTAASYPALGPLIGEKVPGVKRVVRFGDTFNDGAILSYQPTGGLPLRSFRESGCVFVDPGFLEVFSFPLAAGSNMLNKPNTTVISAHTAKELFGNGDAIGKTIRLHNQFGDLALTVTGILRDVPDQSDLQFALLLPMATLADPKYTEGSDWAKPTTWGNDGFTTFLWLGKEADPAKLSALATELWRSNDPDYPARKGTISLQRVEEMHLGRGAGDNRPTYGSYKLTALILLLSFVILVIAWINYVNFATADALTRAREVGIHKIVGSGRGAIIIRTILESAILNLTSGVVAIIITQLCQPVFNYITERPLSLSYLLDWQSWLIIGLVLLAGCAAAGLYTGVILARMRPITAIRFNDHKGRGSVIVRKVLVVSQLAVSCIFIAMTLVAWRQIVFMKNHDLGMDITNLVVIQGPALRDSTFKTKAAAFRNEMAGLPFMKGFACSGSVPGQGSGHNYSADGVTGAVTRAGADRDEYSISEVDERFFSLYGISIKYGRDFTVDDADAGYKGDHLIVNEKAARLLGYEPGTAPGNVIHWNNKVYRIAGVVMDYHHRSLKDPIEPIIFVGQHNNSCYTVEVSREGFATKLSAVRGLYGRSFPGNTFIYHFVKESYDRQYANEDRSATVAFGLASLAILLSILGLVGLSAFTARRRTKEMGIRKVLGASVRSLFGLFSAEYVLLVMIACLIATPVSWVLSLRWLEGFAERIHPSWTIWLFMTVLCMSFTLMAVSFHALRAAFVNVVRQLRTE